MLLTLLSLLVAASAVVVARPSNSQAVAYYDPTAHGGSWLDNAGDGLGEPLNVCIDLIVLCSRLTGLIGAGSHFGP